MFCKPDGTVYDPDRFSREFIRKQEPYNRAHGAEPLPRLTLHGLRHTWATLAQLGTVASGASFDRVKYSAAVRDPALVVAA